MSMTDDQVAKLRGDLEFITAHRARHDQGTWWEGVTMRPMSAQFDDDGAPACGTSGCLAGWAVARQYAEDHRPDGSFISFAHPEEAEDDDGEIHNAVGDLIHLYDTSAVWTNAQGQILDVLGSVSELASSRYGLEPYHTDVLFSGGTTLLQQWEVAADLSDGRITVPANLPADAGDDPSVIDARRHFQDLED